MPETLHALIAATRSPRTESTGRTRGCSAVLGKAFTKRGLAAVSGHDEEGLEPPPSSLVKKEVLSLETDPHDRPNANAFLHALFQKVAYDTLSRKERKARHLAVAAYLEFDAHRGGGRRGDRVAPPTCTRRLTRIRRCTRDQSYGLQATRTRRGAGGVARSERGGATVLRAGRRALRRAEDGRAARARRRGRPLQRALRRHATAHLETAILRGGRLRRIRLPAPRPVLPSSYSSKSRLDPAVPRLEEAFSLLWVRSPDADLAAIAAELGRLYLFAGDHVTGLERVELALETAEARSCRCSRRR